MSFLYFHTLFPISPTLPELFKWPIKLKKKNISSLLRLLFVYNLYEASTHTEAQAEKVLNKLPTAMNNYTV